MHLHPTGSEVLSSVWKHGVILVLILGFTISIWQAAKTYANGPPIPQRVVGPQATTVFMGDDILAGQEAFLKGGSRRWR